MSYTTLDDGPARILSAKPEWHSKELSRFQRNLTIEKERSEHASSLGYNNNNNGTVPTKEGVVSSEHNRSPDAYLLRQRYLRSYTFTREDDETNIDDSKMSEENTICTMIKVVFKKSKKWFDMKKVKSNRKIVFGRDRA